MEFSQQDFEVLLRQIAELTARVHRLEGLLHVSAPQATSPQPVERIGEPTSPHRPTPPPIFAAPASATEHSDLEARIGSHWLNRIGIAAVLIGVSYFLKYAFENNWIGPAGRVGIGLIAGIAVGFGASAFAAAAMAFSLIR